MLNIYPGSGNFFFRIGVPYSEQVSINGFCMQTNFFSNIKRKSKFQIFPIFIFRVMVIFVLKIVNFRLIFTIIQEIKFGKLFFHSFQHIAHVSWKWDQYWGGGVYMSLVGTEHIWYYCEQAPTSYCNTAAVKKIAEHARQSLLSHPLSETPNLNGYIVKEVQYKLLDCHCYRCYTWVWRLKRSRDVHQPSVPVSNWYQGAFSATVFINKYSSFVAAFIHTRW